MDDLRALYQQIIIEYSQRPRNFKAMEDANHECHGHNPLCGDDVTIFAKVENDRVADISFKGSGCAISKASASIMTTQVKGKTLAEVKTMFEAFQNLITTGEEVEDMNSKLLVLGGVHKYPMRVKCAILPWHTMMNGLNNECPQN
jgi:nitrogen fixation NifU-like protein